MKRNKKPDKSDLYSIWSNDKMAGDARLRVAQGPPVPCFCISHPGLEFLRLGAAIVNFIFATCNKRISRIECSYAT
ncbi:hypothetical protein ONS95_001603 [Cadophora gregata]|uniref:uncharacterized protein n=1 Tax=Cadophora gregata TaxID=51156 RepID=UPI0026DBCDE7|nr:uncharacterized protein ONS95_001603 [Cadophora gregata]KAK0111228.1 hypothetical protein ONS95_001603 [Cadophora gregata]